MKIHGIVFITLALLSCFVAAEDGPRTITTLDNQVYKNAVITSVSADEISITYDDGIAKIPRSKLPDEIIKETGMDSVANQKAPVAAPPQQIAEQAPAPVQAPADAVKPKNDPPSHLAARGTEQLLIVDRLYTMTNNMDYLVVGVSPKNHFLIQTPDGSAELKSGRYRVLPGGSYSTTSITLLGGIAQHQWNDGKVSYTWSGQVSTPVALGNVYAAVQWYEGDQIISTDVVCIGAIPANKECDVKIDTEAPQDMKFAIHFWSGQEELRQLEAEKSW